MRSNKIITTLAQKPARSVLLTVRWFSVVGMLLLGLWFSLTLVSATYKAEPDSSQQALLFLPLLNLPDKPNPVSSLTPTSRSDATPTITATPSVNDTATATTDPTALPSSTATAAANETSTPTNIASATATFDPVASPSSTSIASATSTPTSTATATTTAAASATSAPTSTATATTTAVANETSTPTSTATATATPSIPLEYKIVWRQVSNYPRLNSEGQAITLNNKLYSFGGYNPGFRPLCDAYVYDPTIGKKGTWAKLANMPNGKGVTHAAITTDGTYIYILSGYLEGGNNDTVCGSTGQTFGTRIGWRYDPATNSYSRMPDLPATRAAGMAAVVDRKLHYFGGTVRTGGGSRTDAVGDHYVLDLDNPAAGWSTLAPLPNPRHHAATVTYQGKIYAIGGQRGHDGGLIPEAYLHIYDPASDTWNRLADLPEARNHIGNTTSLLNGKIYVLGGQFTSDVSRNTIYAYDIAANTWATISDPLPVARHSAIGGAINGKLYFSSGENNSYSLEGSFVPVTAATQLSEALTRSVLVGDLERQAAFIASFNASSDEQNKLYCSAPPVDEPSDELAFSPALFTESRRGPRQANGL